MTNPSRSGKAGAAGLAFVMAMGCTGGAGPGNVGNTVQSGGVTEASSPSPRGAEDALTVVAGRVQGFGGAYLDERQRLVILTVDPSQRAAAEREVRARFGEAVASSVTVFRSADYDLSQLEAWRSALRTIPFKGPMTLDVDERANRVRVGTTGEFSEVEATLSRLGIPREAVVMERQEPFVPAVGSTRR